MFQSNSQEEKHLASLLEKAYNNKEKNQYQSQQWISQSPQLSFTHSFPSTPRPPLQLSPLVFSQAGNCREEAQPSF